MPKCMLDTSPGVGCGVGYGSCMERGWRVWITHGWGVGGGCGCFIEILYAMQGCNSGYNHCVQDYNYNLQTVFDFPVCSSAVSSFGKFLFTNI